MKRTLLAIAITACCLGQQCGPALPIGFNNLTGINLTGIVAGVYIGPVTCISTTTTSIGDEQQEVFHPPDPMTYTRPFGFDGTYEKFAGVPVGIGDVKYGELGGMTWEGVVAYIHPSHGRLATAWNISWNMTDSSGASITLTGTETDICYRVSGTAIDLTRTLRVASTVDGEYVVLQQECTGILTR